MTIAPRRPATADLAPGSHWRQPAVLVVLTAVLVVSVTAGISIGSVRIPPGQVWSNLAAAVTGGRIDATGPPFVQAIVTQSRAPRVLLAVVVGAGLAVVGAALQALVRNMLADPFLLGVSSGASVAAVLVIISGATAVLGLTTPVAAFLGALLALFVVYAMSRSGGQVTPTRLVLSGVAVAYVLSALTSLLLILAARPDAYREVLAWLLGSLGRATWDLLWLPTGAVVVGVAILLAAARPLNLLLAGDEAATTMGVDVPRFRAGMFVLTSLVTGVLVSVSGPIGFVGLIVPHAVRLVVGSDHRRLLPAAALSGASFLVWADIAARTVASPIEVPVGVLTALCGGPFFLWLVRREARRGTRTSA
ncbi:FecCD family ABC transporter permease [Pseudonocardia sp. HH130630-07]|uniref:FecCD family ABC transporter permease n=1 Tax=Pseudonocardia sp. HH130630-07 TaxID=1690815 RepID=UPI0009F39883|nr:iron ABC transporter permease [Pseudonocardia sp. HH130630-07]